MLEIFFCVFAVYGLFCALRELYLILDKRSASCGKDDNDEGRTERK